jgi:hypothetical protein
VEEMMGLIGMVEMLPDPHQSYVERRMQRPSRRRFPSGNFNATVISL